MLVGVPIGACLCLAGIVYILDSGDTVLFQSFPVQMFGGVDSYSLIAIPLFILIGEIMLMYELFSVIEKHTTGWAHRGSQNQ